MLNVFCFALLLNNLRLTIYLFIYCIIIEFFLRRDDSDFAPSLLSLKKHLSPEQFFTYVQTHILKAISTFGYADCVGAISTIPTLYLIEDIRPLKYFLDQLYMLLVISFLGNFKRANFVSNFIKKDFFYCL